MAEAKADRKSQLKLPCKYILVHVYVQVSNTSCHLSNVPGR